MGLRRDRRGGVDDAGEIGRPLREADVDVASLEVQPIDLREVCEVLHPLAQRAVVHLGLPPAPERDSED